MAVCSHIRNFHPATKDQEKPSSQPEPKRRRGRPKGSRTTPRSVKPRHDKVLGVQYADNSDLPPELWNLLTSLVVTVFRSLLKICRQLRVEAPGHKQEQILFVELPRRLFRVVREIAEWWWSNLDRGFIGTTLTCPQCGMDLKFKENVKKKIVTLYGIIRPHRCYYYCSRKKGGCGYSLAPLDQRLGLDRDHFLPSVQQRVTWLTSLDPFGKCLQYVAKLLHFSISPRTAWLITQKVADVVEARENEAIERTFGDPTNSVFPDPEPGLHPPDVGVLQFDGTNAPIDYFEDEKPDTADELGLREVKAALVAHLVPPVSSRRKQPSPEPPSAPQLVVTEQSPAPTPIPPESKPTPPSDAAPVPKTKNKKSCAPEPKPPSQAMSAAQPTRRQRRRRQWQNTPRRKKKRKLPQPRPTLAHKKTAVHLGLGTPTRLFQLALLLIYRLNLHQAKVLLVIGDGAHWIWCGVRDHLSSLGVTIVEILDFWHGVEHLWALANGLFGQGTPEARDWVESREQDLLNGRLSTFFESLQAALNLAKETKASAIELVQTELTYFRNNEYRINYAEYLSKGYLIGSGAMEGTNNHHIKQRIDQGGMRWGPSGAMAVLRNRTLIKNGDWDHHWKQEAEQRWKAYNHLKNRCTVATTALTQAVAA